MPQRSTDARESTEPKRTVAKPSIFDQRRKTSTPSKDGTRQATFGPKFATAAELAADPKLAITFARKFQENIDAQLEAFGMVMSDPGPISSGKDRSRIDPQAVFDFYNAQLQLQQDFVDAESERLFGSQDITSRSSTVNAAGARTPVPGHGSIATPEQIAEIEARFLTPLQLIEAGKDPNSLVRPPGPEAKPRTPTIVSGAGAPRRRPRGVGAQRSTILTSDADALSGGPVGRTLLG